MIAVLRQRLCKHTMKHILFLRNKFIKHPKLSELYFAYGANLDPDRFKKLNMQAKELGNASLPNHELKFSLPCEYLNKGYAGVHSSLEQSVPGVLYQLDKISLIYLDILEWCGFGAYKRIKKEIKVLDKTVDAWVYIVKKPDFNRFPSKLYLNNMIKAAKLRNFPRDYIQFLDNHPFQEQFVIDPSFSLLTYSQSRLFLRQLLPFYQFHDKWREKLCQLL
jgi:gamma-glutamylcyclotransferase